MKRNTKAQWMNLQQNSSFINHTQFPLCEKSGAILLVLVGFTAGWQSDEILVAIFRNFEISPQIALLGFSRSLTKVRMYSVIIIIVLQTDFSRFFCEMEARESWTPCFFRVDPYY